MALIEIRGLKKLYRMGDSIVQALAGVDLDIEKGEFVAITGASGSGKSTMMHLIGCLDRPSAGTYRLNGKDVSNMSDGELALVRNREIGFVFQTFNLINRTAALENVSVPLFYARKYDPARARLALKQVGLSHRMDHKPSEMSGGERQRTAIARAIVNDPVLLLADEPTGNLDSRTGEQIMQVFHDLNAQGVTIVLVTHEPDIARQAQRIVSMRDGKIVADCTPDEVLGGDMHATMPQEKSPQLGVGEQSGAGPAVAVIPREAVRSSRLPQAAAGAPDDGPVLTAPIGSGVPFVDQLTPRMAPGATWPLIISIVAWALLLSGNFIPILYPAVLKPVDREALQKGVKALPPEMQRTIALQSMMALTALLSLGLSIVAILWARAKLLYIRSELGNWQGRKRIKVGLWLGIGIPVFMIGAFILRRLL